ncbi:hypothetical protein J6590_047725 [Homalodisca vitripennis]|nr:hypothetical protein J6590_047725 [Homalodisca vitripennis]
MSDSHVRKEHKLPEYREPEIRKLECLLKIMENVSNIQSLLFATLSCSLRNVNLPVGARTTELNEEAKRLESRLDKLARNTAENELLKIRVATLERLLEEHNKYMRKNSIEIHGVPERKMESLDQLMTKIKEVGNALDYNLRNWMIDFCYRIQNKTDNKRPAVIFVRFVRRIDKDQLLARRRARQNFTTLDIGFLVDQRIDLCEVVNSEWSTDLQYKQEENTKVSATTSPLSTTLSAKEFGQDLQKY